MLAVPIAQDRATMHLDTVCTMVDRDAVVMYPQIADTLEAYRRSTPTARVGGREPFLRGRGARDGDRASCASSTPAWTR